MCFIEFFFFSFLLSYATSYSEPKQLAACVHEFSEDTEKYIKAGEEITGIPYEWGVYDMVVLPSAFPYGGTQEDTHTCC